MKTEIIIKNRKIFGLSCVFRHKCLDIPLHDVSFAGKTYGYDSNEKIHQHLLCFRKKGRNRRQEGIRRDYIKGVE